MFVLWNGNMLFLHGVIKQQIRFNLVSAPLVSRLQLISLILLVDGVDEEWVVVLNIMVGLGALESIKSSEPNIDKEIKWWGYSYSL